MMNNIIVTTLLLASILQIEATFKSVSSDRLIITRNSRFRPLVTKSLDQLIYVSFPAYPHPKIKLESELANDMPCELDFPTMDDIEQPLSFNSLANGRLVLSLIGSEDLLYRYVLTLVIDPEKCEFLAVTTTLSNETTNDNSVVVLPGEDVFDVFLQRQQHCAEAKACRLRYSGDDGQLIGVTEFDVPEDAESWMMDSVVESNFTDGFFYSVLMKNGTSVVQRLEQDLKVQKELKIDKSFLYSASHDSVNNCRGVSTLNLECDLRDADFESRSGVVIVETEYFKSFMRAARLINLLDGSAIIVYVLQVFSEPSIANQFATYLQHVDLHGHAANPVKFQENVCKDFKDLKGIRMRDNFYCFVVSCRDAIFTKCAVIGEM